MARRSGRRNGGGTAAAAVLGEVDPNGPSPEEVDNDNDNDNDNDGDDDDEYMASASKAPRRHFAGGNDGGNDDDDDDDDGEYLAPLGSPSPRRPPRGGKKGGSRGSRRHMQRRRSSARFLRLSGRFGIDHGEDGGEDGGGSGSGDFPGGGGGGAAENLGEVYRQAIRMNAENRINAGNSWGLRLIENMDQLLGDDGGGGGGGAGGGGGGKGGGTAEDGGGINFTKASCTLDASVKIYGYRVDDVHLTSYKVLHNLNRTDATKADGRRGGNAEDGSGDGAAAHGGGGDDDGAGAGRSSSGRRAAAADTLETNLANINMSKLDCAPDIDPLFRKMSKAFDEGGARGLLLNNLGVARDGCRVEFDSKEDAAAEGQEKEQAVETEEDAEAVLMEEEEAKAEEETEEAEADAKEEDDGPPAPEAGEAAAPARAAEGDVDISGLVQKLRDVLGGSALEDLPFVPQLEGLREDCARLEAEGYSGARISGTTAPVLGGRGRGGRAAAAAAVQPPARYGVTEEEEKEAERSIHLEAMERSHRSAGNTSFAAMASAAGEGVPDGEGGEDGYGADDFGGGADDDDGFADDDAFTNFLAMEGGNADRYSAIEFRSSEASEEVLPGTAMRTRATTAALLDAICSSDALGAGGEFEYFNSDTLDRITKGNLWAGSEHWKKTDKIRTRKQKEESEMRRKKRPSRKKASRERAFLDLRAPSQSLVDGLINSKPAKGRTKSDPLRLTKAAIQKQEKNVNLLPLDAGVGLDQLSRLFMRPEAAVQPRKQVNERRVGFLDMAPTAFDDGDNDSFGGDNDGPGFNLADGGDDDSNDDFVIGDLEGVRKVDKVSIGYATVARKVDVKRLKKDLWSNLETKTAVADVSEKAESPEAEEAGTDADKKEKEIDDDGVKGEDQKPNLQDGEVSFQETLKELSVSQSQSSVTLPFYFICVLHLANEKGLRLQSTGEELSDFTIVRDDGSAPTFGIMPGAEPVKTRRARGGGKKAAYSEDSDCDESMVEDE